MRNAKSTAAVVSPEAPCPTPNLMFAGDDAPTVPAFVRRQPLLDASEKLAGYELRFGRHEIPSPSLGSTPAELNARLLSLLATLEINRIAERKFVVVALDSEALQQPVLDLLPRDSLILAVRLPGSLTPTLVASLKQTWARGFCIAFDDYAFAPETAYLLDVASYVRLDVARYNALELARQAAFVLENSGARLIAANVRSRDEFEACRNLPFDYYQGEFFTAHQPRPAATLDHERVQVIGILNQVRQKEELTAIERGFRRDPALVYRLLRYINSPAVGLQREIPSIAHALIVLGYDQLYRWLTLLLFACGPEAPRNRAVLTHALVRGRLVELLGKDALGPAERDSLFVVGIFSMLDALLGIPLRQALSEIHLPPAATAALLDNAGIYAPYLQLAISCEAEDNTKIWELAAECRLDSAAVNAAHVQALLWADSLD